MSIVIRGDTTEWAIPVLAAGGGAFPLNGCTVWVTVKPQLGDVADDAAIYQHYLVVADDGSEAVSKGMRLGVGGAAAGIVEQELTPQESRLLSAGTFFYDVQVAIPVEGSNPLRYRVYTPIKDQTETVELDQTRSIDPPTS